MTARSWFLVVFVALVACALAWPPTVDVFIILMAFRVLWQWVHQVVEKR